MVRFLIWDFDGTLFSTYPRIVDDFRLALLDYGIDEPADAILSHVKISVGSAVQWYTQAHHLDGRLRERYSVHEHDRSAGRIEPQPYPGALEVCRSVAKAGGSNLLYTHRDRAAWDWLGEHGFTPFFSGGVTREDHFPDKPAPDALLHLLAAHNLPPHETLMVGDRDIDLLAGRAAGIGGCLFDPDGFYDSFETPLRVRAMAELQAWLAL